MVVPMKMANSKRGKSDLTTSVHKEMPILIFIYALRLDLALF